MVPGHVLILKIGREVSEVEFINQQFGQVAEVQHDPPWRSTSLSNRPGEIRVIFRHPSGIASSSIRCDICGAAYHTLQINPFKYSPSGKLSSTG